MSFRKLTIVSAMALGLVMSACGTGGDLGGIDVSQGAFVDEREIVALVPDAAARAAMEEFALANGYTLREVTPLAALNLIMLSFEMPDGTKGPEAIAELEGAVPGSTVGVNHAYREQVSSPGASSLSYANTMLNWPGDACPAQVPIGLIDSHITVSATGLSARQVTTQSFVDGPRGSSRHGTEVASVLADATRLSGTILYSAVVVEDTVDAGRAAGADAIVKALDWLSEEEAKVVNISLAGPYNKLLALGVQRATERGLILVAAVGNSGPSADALYPAAFDPVIAVTAVDAEAEVYRRAGRGAHVDIAAPGVDVLANAAEGSRFVTGTSIAAPFVSARIAADPALARATLPAQVLQRLASSSRDLGQPGPDSTYGVGLMQAAGLCRR